MTDKLTEFLTNLATDEKLVEAFKADNVGTMKAHGVSDEHIELVVNKKYDEIRQVLGDDYEVAIESIIKAIKK